MTKISVITVKGLEPATSCVRDLDATIGPARHMWETGSWNSVQFMLQWFITFLEFAEFTEFNESSAPLRKNFNIRFQLHRITEMCLTVIIIWINVTYLFNYFYRPPTKLQEGIISSHVCPLVILSSGERGSTCDHNPWCIGPHSTSPQLLPGHQTWDRPPLEIRLETPC